MKKFFMGAAFIVLGAAASYGQNLALQSASNPHLVGQRLPSGQRILNQWANDALDKSDAKPQPLLSSVQEFKDLIESDPELFMQFHQMFEQIPAQKTYEEDPTGAPQIKDYQRMLTDINTIITKAPEFSYKDRKGLVGFPINAILDWPMNTPTARTVFLNAKVNRALKKILRQWAVFLSSKDSRQFLSEDPKKGWFSPDALKAMWDADRNPKKDADAKKDFFNNFVCDKRKPYYGFSSWDDFFTRRFREGRRPVDDKKDDSVIVNACESAPDCLARNVKGDDRFWIKEEPYSLYQMMDGDPLVAQFVGGTIYQAFLSALSYHRWHSPVSGKIVKVKLIEGSYYAEAPSVGFDSPTPDAAAPNDSQPYITHFATRALVFIQSDNPQIGLICVMFVGMAEVSSCEVTVNKGQRVLKGDELGMFHYGGSTYALIFRPGVNLQFDPSVTLQLDDLHGCGRAPDSKNILVKSRIATVLKN